MHTTARGLASPLYVVYNIGTVASVEESPTPARRPTHDDPRVVARHMGAIREDVRQYLVSEGDEDPDMDRAMAEVERAMRWSTLDGYEIARELDSRGWSADSQLVELMDQLAWRRYDAHHDVVCEWVKSENIKPALGVGDLVTIKARRKGAMVAEPFDGEITSVREDEARYVVLVEALGHVREGVGSHGIVMAYEDVTKREK